jgi:hypothetical protein
MLLCIAPVVFAQSARMPGEWRYPVAPGDTLVDIAARHLTRPAHWQSLQRLNGIDEPRRLRPGSVLRIPLAWMRRPSVAEVVFVQGDVSLRHGPAGEPTDLTVGSSLHEHDVIRTVADGSVTLRFADGSRLLVTQDTELAIGPLLTYGPTGITSTRLRLARGNADAQVVHKSRQATSFEITTPVVNLGVRGTEFRVGVDPDGASTRLEVLEGTVATTTRRGKARVGAGFGTVVQLGQRVSATERLSDAPDLRGAPTLIERVPLMLAWQPTAQASGYRAQVFAADSSARLLLDGVFVDASAKWADLPNGQYVLRVRALDAHGLGGVDAHASFTVNARPEPPFIRQDAVATKSYGEVATFEWTRSSAAARYHLQVAAASDFPAPVVDADDIITLQYSVPLPPGAYHWRVASIASDGHHGPFSDVQNRVQAQLPASPVLEPTQLTDAGLVFRWRAPNAGEVVQFQVASESDFRQLLLDFKTDGSQGLLPQPLPGIYYLRARTIDADGVAGDFGATQQIEVTRSVSWWWLPAAALLLLL